MNRLRHAWRRWKGQSAEKPAGHASAEGALRLALLIDAENISPRLLGMVLDETARHGRSSVRRIYGDWTTSELAPWKPLLNRHAIQPIQQFRYTQGKNSSDAAMIIDAMDLLHTRRFDGFCLVTSDSDFTRLACRIREEGLFVLGLGMVSTPLAFQAACDRFEVLRELPATPAPALVLKQPANLASPGVDGIASQGTRSTLDLAELLLRAYARAAEKWGDEWVPLCNLGDHLRQIQPGFRPKDHGYPMLTGLVIASGLFQLERRPTGKKGGPMACARPHPNLVSAPEATSHS